MKIFIFSKSSWNVYNFRKNLIKSLIKKKNKVFIFCKKDQYNKKLVQIGCKTIDLNFDNDKINFFKDFKAFIKICNYSKKIKPDYLLNFNIKPMIYGSLLSRYYKIKCINTITGLGTIFLKSNFIKNIFLFIYKIVFSSNNIKIFFHNKDDKNLFIKKKIVLKKNAFLVWGSGVDTKFFYYKKIKNKKKIVFLFIGRLIFSKGIREFVEASKYFINNKLISFEMIGPLSSSKKIGFSNNEIKTITKQKNLFYLGNQNDVREYIAASSCVVLPSYREGMPKSLLEASAMGRPLIASTVEGSKDIVVNGYNGYKCKVKDVKKLILVLKKFKNTSYMLRNKMSINSRKQAVENFNEKLIINKYIKIIDNF